MTGVYCSVSVCRNSKTNTTGKNISFHTLPKNKTLRKIWIRKCRKANSWNPKSCVICSVHFTEEDFERDLRSELLNLSKKRRLKSNAVPSLKLNGKEGDDSLAIERKKRMKRREAKKIVEELLLASEKSEHLKSSVNATVECLHGNHQSMVPEIDYSSKEENLIVSINPDDLHQPDISLILIKTEEPDDYNSEDTEMLILEQPLTPMETLLVIDDNFENQELFKKSLVVSEISGLDSDDTTSLSNQTVISNDDESESWRKKYETLMVSYIEMQRRLQFSSQIIKENQTKIQSLERDLTNMKANFENTCHFKIESEIDIDVKQEHDLEF